MGWVWDKVKKVYRGSLLGLPIRTRRIIGWRDKFISRESDDATELTRQMADGEITRQRWERLMGEKVAENMTSLYALGRGGRQMMSSVDKDILKGMIRNQRDYLRRFSTDIRDGKVSPAQAMARTKLYMGAGTQAYEQASARAHGAPDLPQYPGDGNTQCLGNCQCHLEYAYEPLVVRVRWVLGRAEHCPDCIALAASWNPLDVARASAKAVESIAQQYASAPSQHLVLIEEDSGDILAETDGDAYGVGLSRAVRAHQKGNVLVHNHPAPFDHIFSSNDLRAAANGEMAEMWAVTRERAYVFRPPKKSDMSPNAIKQQWKIAAEKVWPRWEARGWIHRLLGRNRFWREEKMYRETWTETFKAIKKEYKEDLRIDIYRWDGRNEGSVTSRRPGSRIWTD